MTYPKNLAREARKRARVVSLPQEELAQLYLKTANENRRLKEEIKILKDQATKDPLTDVLNRRGFYENVLELAADTRRDNYGIERRIASTSFRGEQKSKAESEKDVIVVIGIDIDHFKSCNDKHGHSFGDAVLKKLASVLKTHLRPKDIVARFGGEEFYIVTAIKAKNHEATGKELAEKVRQIIEKDCVLPNPKFVGTVGVTGSLGVGFMRVDDPRVIRAVHAGSVTTDFMESLDEDLTIVDQALYAAKTSGRNTVCLTSEIERITRPQFLLATSVTEGAGPKRRSGHSVRLDTTARGPKRTPP